MIFNDVNFRCPDALTLSPNPVRRALLVGSCLSELLCNQFKYHYSIETDFVLINSVRWHKAAPPRPLADYDLIIVNIPLSLVIPDSEQFKLPAQSPGEHRNIFSWSARQLHGLAESVLNWTRESDIPTFVANFIIPQQHSSGRLHSPFKHPDIRILIEKLNFRLLRQISRTPNSYLLDIEQIAASIGKRYILDDFVWASNHNAVQSDFDFFPRGMEGDRSNADPRLPKPLSELTGFKSDTFLQACAHEVLSMLRTLRQIDRVKLIVIDLDETLWPGVPAETGDPVEVSALTLGFLESLSILRKRGLLLGIISRNEHSVIEKIWEQSLAKLLPLSSFTFIKIDWSSKSESMAQILTESGILPEHTVYIDTSARERAEVQAAFPQIRVLGQTLYDVRRTLLWSSETQTEAFTPESSRRHELTIEKLNRDKFRATVSKEKFFDELKLSVDCSILESAQPAEAARVIELINRTNQFNTTGERRDLRNLTTFLQEGGTCVAVSAQDRFSNYGLISAALIKNAEIVQWVMSCRVLGLEIEAAVLYWLEGRKLLPQSGGITAHFIRNHKNHAAQQSLQQLNFSIGATADRMIAVSGITPPGHITFT